MCDPELLGQAVGLREPGNINLFNRPQVKNADGSISTVRSIGVGFDDGEYLLPTVSEDGRIMADREAIEAFFRSRRHLGRFDTPENAENFGRRLHDQQDRLYGKAKSK